MFQKTIDFLSLNWVGVIICMVITLFICWTIGYFSNAHLGTHYELQSCWLGVAAVCAASVTGLGKYWTDSKHNSLQNEMPYIKGGNGNV